LNGLPSRLPRPEGELFIWQHAPRDRTGKARPASGIPGLGRSGKRPVERKRRRPRNNDGGDGSPRREGCLEQSSIRRDGCGQRRRPTGREIPGGRPNQRHRRKRHTRGRRTRLCRVEWRDIGERLSPLREIKCIANHGSNRCELNDRPVFLCRHRHKFHGEQAARSQDDQRKCN
jgi:hypothetical protein